MGLKLTAATSPGEPDGQAAGTLWDRPGFLVRRLHQIHVAMFLEECAGASMTPVQYGLLSILAEAPGLDQVALAAELGIDRTNVADVLERLERRGLLTRAVNPRDRRMKLATLTNAGKGYVRKNRALMLRAQERLLDPLSPGDARSFMALLRRLVEENN
ncbi:MAG: MarR family transcriptional regulator, partial [Alphaproteobacteria bacterium]